MIGDLRPGRALVLHAGPRAGSRLQAEVISVSMSASFFWMSWLAASGRPNCLRSIVYWRAASPAGTRPRRASRPGDAEARGVGAGERALSALTSGNVLFRHEDLVHAISPVIEGVQADLAVDGGADKPFQPFSRRSRDLAGVVLGPLSRTRRRSGCW